MFGRQGGLSGATGASGGNLVEFRAGRMNLVGKMVHPDARKGLVYLTQSEDGLMHFCWKDRTTGKVEDDLIVFPDDFEFRRVEQCKTGRVYVLKFKTSSRRLFFWMQEPKEDKDEEFCRRVNELMNNPPSQQRGGTDGGDLQYMLNNMSQQQLMQLFGGVGQMGGLSSLLGSMNRPGGENSSTRTGANRSAAATAAALTSENPGAAPRASNASATKSKTNKRAGAEAGGASGTTDADNSKPAGGAANTETEHGAALNVDLSNAIVTSDAVNELVSDSQRVKALSVHLPDSINADEDRKQQVKETIASPQFQQALTLFSNALQSAQLGPVVSQFELPTDAVTAAFSGNLEDFVKALEKALPAGTTMEESPGSPAKTDDAKKEESKEDGKQSPSDENNKNAE